MRLRGGVFAPFAFCFVVCLFAALPAAAQTCSPYDIRNIDATGDSITKAFNGQGAFPCPFADQPQYNWATSDTHGTNYCSGGGSVYSVAERLECLQGRDLLYEGNHAVSGADMLKDFVNQANGVRASLDGSSLPSMVTVLMGHNDICGGKVWKYLWSCSAGGDQDRDNYCRTTPAAYERQFRKGLDVLMTRPNTKIAVASMVRVSQLCNHGYSKWSCSWFMPCQWGWSAVAYGGFIFGRDNGICGSLTADCSDQRVADAYTMSKRYRDILQRVTAEYAAIPVGGTSAQVWIGGQWVGGAVKESGVSFVYSDATWRYEFEDAELNCCDCFHPSPLGQNAGARITTNGLTCSSSDRCCLDASWDPVGSGRCRYLNTGGRSFPGFFQ